MKLENNYKSGKKLVKGKEEDWSQNSTTQKNIRGTDDLEWNKETARDKIT